MPAIKPIIPPLVPVSSVPPLEPGDHLTRDEFERRFDAMPELKKAELIEGIVYMPSLVRLNRHGRPHADLISWLGFYRTGTPGVQSADNATVRLDRVNEHQPDAILYVDPAIVGSSVRISTDDYVEGAPEWAGEIAASSASIDLGTKLQVYQRNRVQEYLVWRVLDRAIDWFALRDNQYTSLALGPDGIYRSAIFPGLWLDPAAMIRSDLATVFAVVQQGLASAEHAAFVGRLKP